MYVCMYIYMYVCVYECIIIIMMCKTYWPLEYALELECIIASNHNDIYIDCGYSKFDNKLKSADTRD